MPGLTQDELHKRALEEIQEEIKRINLEPITDMKKHWLFCLGGVLTTALRLEAISHEEYKHYRIVKDCLWKSITEKHID